MPSTDPDTQVAPRKKTRFRMVLVVGGILVIEAVVIIGAMLLLGGPPQVQAAVPPATLEAPADEKIVEVLVFSGKLPNNKSGVTYLYSTEIYAQVKTRYADRVNDELGQFRNEIKSEITAIWRTSDPRHFQEPKLQTLTRKIQSMLDERFGVDLRRDEPIISKCVIVMGTGFRVDS